MVVYLLKYNKNEVNMSKDNNNTCFLITILKPKAHIENKLDIYEQENKIDKYCINISLCYFALMYLLFLAILLFFNAKPLILVMFFSILIAAITTGLYWFLCYIQAFVVGMLEHKYSIKRIFLASFIKWNE